MTGWGLAAALGAVAGALVAPRLTLTPGMMDGVLVYALAAVILGGLSSRSASSSPPGRSASWRISRRCTSASFGYDLKVAVPFILIFVVLIVRPRGCSAARSRCGSDVVAHRPTSRTWVRPVITIVVVVAVLVAPLFLSEYTNQTLARIGVFAVAVLGLNVVMGYTGQVSLGQIFFLGVGAYVTAYGATQGWNIVLVFVLSVLVPGVIGLGVALAAARLGGLAIAMVTIALPIVGVPLAKRLSDFTGGSQGLSASFSNAPEWSPLFDDQWRLYLVILIGGAVFLLTRNLVRGKYGRAFAIVKSNEAVAASMGISPYRYKVLAFTIASLIGGVSGFLYMAIIQFTSPETMSFATRSCCSRRW